MCLEQALVPKVPAHRGRAGQPVVCDEWMLEIPQPRRGSAAP